MAQETFTVAGVPVAQVIEQIQKAGVSRSDAALLAGSWIFENLGRTQRTFNYATDFPPADPHCVSAFVKSFAHQDWVDGESVVQAEQTTGEEGFNVRFHRIEGDLAGLGEEVAKAFTCLAEMRRELRSLLDELRAEINRLNSDVFDLRTRGGVLTAPPPGGGRITDVLDASQFKGVTKFLNKDVAVWQTAQGLMVLPAITAVAANPEDDPRVSRVRELSKLLQQDQDIRGAFTGPVTKGELVARFGDVVGPEGTPLKALVAILPEGAQFASPDALTNDVAEREAGAISTSEERVGAIADALGVGEAGVQGIASAPVTALGGVPPAASTALAASGITSIDKLAAADPDEVARTLTTSGVRVTASDVAGWTGTAKVLIGIQRFR